MLHWKIFRRCVTDMNQVDAFVVVHAGQGAERTGDAIDLWSVKWTLPKARETDGEYFSPSASLAADLE